MRGIDASRIHSRATSFRHYDAACWRTLPIWVFRFPLAIVGTRLQDELLEKQRPTGPSGILSASIRRWAGRNAEIRLRSGERPA